MKIKALKPFTYRNSSTGELTSVACGQIAEFDDTLAEAFISDGLAEEYTLITPTGTKTITENGSYDVTTYAQATVNVGTYTVTYDVNGGTGTLDNQTVIAGNTVVLSDGTGVTAPEGTEFVGWGEESSSTEPVESPYKPTANVTLYAIYEATETSESDSSSESESQSEG